MGKRVAVWDLRAVPIDPVPVKAPVVRSYKSAEANAAPVELVPPATKTLPVGSSVAVWTTRAVPMLPVAVQVPGVPGGSLQILQTKASWPPPLVAWKGPAVGKLVEVVQPVI